MASGSTKIILTRDGQTKNIANAGDSAIAWFQTRPVDFNDPKASKYADEYVVDVENYTDTLCLEIGLQERLSDETWWNTPMSLVAGDDFLVQQNDARFFTFKFVDSAVSKIWKISAFEVYGAASFRSM